jgi:hypothetical protein
VYQRFQALPIGEVLIYCNLSEILTRENISKKSYLTYFLGEIYMPTVSVYFPKEIHDFLQEKASISGKSIPIIVSEIVKDAKLNKINHIEPEIPTQTTQEPLLLALNSLSESILLLAKGANPYRKNTTPDAPRPPQDAPLSHIEEKVQKPNLPTELENETCISLTPKPLPPLKSASELDQTQHPEEKVSKPLALFSPSENSWASRGPTPFHITPSHDENPDVSIHEIPF